MKLRTALIPPLSAMLLTLPQVGWSQPHDELVIEGFAGAGVGYFRLEGEEFPEGTDNFSDDRIAWKAFAGLDLSRVLGIEVAYLDFGEATYGPAALEATGISVAGIVAFPITETFAPYGKLGRLWWDADQTISGTTTGQTGDEMFFGIGARFSLASRADVRIEYERFDVYDTDLDLVSANLQIRF